MTLRPLVAFVHGRFEFGLEFVIEDGILVRVGPQTGMPEPILLSPPFVNAHSHWEYRGLLGKVLAPEYWEWLRELTELKRTQTANDIVHECAKAAEENLRAGVDIVGEHSDRPGSAEALRFGPKSGILYQEVITFFEQHDPTTKLAELESCFIQNKRKLGAGWKMGWAPHAPFTVDSSSLKLFASKDDPISIHVAEHEAENQFFMRGEGPIADFYQRNGFEVPAAGLTSVEYVLSHGFCGPGVQFVHACVVSEQDIEAMARAGITVAHCPRSNMRLGCRTAPIRRMVQAGMDIGLGLDSVASSGPINMIEEMRAAYRCALELGEPLSVEQIWSMATHMGARSLGFALPELTVGSPANIVAVPLVGGDDPEGWLFDCRDHEVYRP